ncbi:MAG: ParB N-terminal domain-containing protein [Planctomycetaceae bacterium]|nr:ParB N-terminal domain-containing protein [Planctomycetaceae bacterium]
MPTVKERKTKKAIPPTEIRRIPIGDIHVSTSRREIEQDKVYELAESIQEVGLLNPVTITRDMHLVAGAHRLEACQVIGHHDIACTFLEGDSLHVELAEIDENLIRNDLDAISIGELALRRDEILEVLGVRAKVGDNQHNQTGRADTTLPRTTTSIANEIGVSNDQIGRATFYVIEWNTLLNNRIGALNALAEKLASGEGLLDTLFVQPAILCQTDEIDGMIRAFNKPNINSETLFGTLLTLYSSSASSLPRRLKAGNTNSGVIVQPHFTLFGTATPTLYYKSLSEQLLTNGFFARTLILDVGKRPLMSGSRYLAPVASIWM